MHRPAPSPAVALPDRTPAPTGLLDGERLAFLIETGLLDSDAEEAFDRLTRAASRLLRAPVSLVSLVDHERQFFKSSLGLPEPWATVRGTPLTHSFCQHVVISGEPLVIEDARDSDLVRDNPAIRDLGVVAYAGIPLTTAAGHALGSFCVIDSVPRVWSEDELGVLKDLAAAAVAEIELRHAKRMIEKANAELEAHNQILRAITTDMPLSEVLAALVGELEAITPGLLASVQLWDPVARKLVNVAAPSLPPEYAEAIAGVEIGPASSPCGTAAHRRLLVVAHDLQGDPRWSDSTGLASRFGVRACWATPILSASGDLLGTFALYLREPGSPTATDLRHIDDASRLAAIAIERRQAEEELSRRALHDYLTGVPNRALLADRLEQALVRARRNPELEPALVLVDLNDFKSINDQRGHAAGDQVLVETAARLCTVVRAEDTVSRLGGDEFVVLCDSATGPIADMIAARVEAAFDAPFVLDGEPVGIAASVGVARVTSSGQTADELMRAADAAMYRVKHAASRA